VQTRRAQRFGDGGVSLFEKERESLFQQNHRNKISFSLSTSDTAVQKREEEKVRKIDLESPKEKEALHCSAYDAIIIRIVCVCVCVFISSDTNKRETTTRKLSYI
jgi:hypothetical protein